MPSPTVTASPFLIVQGRHLRLLQVLILVGVGLLIGAFVVPSIKAGLALLGAGLSVLWVVLILRLLSWYHTRRIGRALAALKPLLADDPAQCLVTDRNAQTLWQNGEPGGADLLARLSEVATEPSVLSDRLLTRAEAIGAASREITVGSMAVRVNVHCLPGDLFLWRLDRVALAEAQCDCGLPMMLVDDTDVVQRKNPALDRISDGDVRTLGDLILDLPLRSGDFHRLRVKGGTAHMRVAELPGPEGTRQIYALPMPQDGPADWGVLDALPVALLKISDEGRVLLANRAARELLGDHGAAGQPLADLVKGLGRSVTDWAREAAAGKSYPKPEVLRAAKPARETFLQIALNRVQEGGKNGLIAVLSDATQLKSLERQFVQSQKMQAIGQLAGGVAHDFNNLLTAISGYCDLLLLRHEATDTDYGDLMQIHQNANRAAALVGQLLAFSRKQTLKPEVLDMRETLPELSHLLNRLVGEKVTLSVRQESELSLIRADRRQLEQVVMNLVVNARDAMRKGGDIQIRTANLRLDAPWDRGRVRVPAGDYVQIDVADQGSGIDPDRLDKIFEPFYTTKRTGEGTGLGLSTAYGIVKQTGGYIFVDSVPGQGSVFSLIFPAAEADEIAPTTEDADHTSDLAHDGAVLLVEDEAPVRAFAARALRLRGMTVIEAENGEDALERLRDPDLEVDIFVTDVIMPGLDGPGWVAEALKTRPGARVVFMSGYAEEGFSDQQSAIPKSVFLPKPFSLVELTQTVQEQIQLLAEDRRIEEPA